MFRLHLLDGGELFNSHFLDGPSRRLKQNNVALMPSQEFFFVGGLRQWGRQTVRKQILIVSIHHLDIKNRH